MIYSPPPAYAPSCGGGGPSDVNGIFCLCDTHLSPQGLDKATFSVTSWCGSIRSSVPRQKAGRASADLDQVLAWPSSSRPSLCRLPPQACRRPFDHLCDSPLDFIWLHKAEETSSRLCNPGALKPLVTHHCPQQVQTHEGLPWSAFCLLRQPLPAAVHSTL